MQCKDIPDLPILQFLGKLERGEITSSYESEGKDAVDGRVYWQSHWGSTWSGCAHGVPHAMPDGVNTPEKLVLAKMASLIKRNLVTGCACGCRGDFELTEKGRQVMKEEGNGR